MTDLCPSPWFFHFPVKIVAGSGSLSHLPSLLPEQGALLLVTTEGALRRGTVDAVRALLPGRTLILNTKVTPNPQIDDLDAAIATLASESITAIIAIGGGSAIDTAKVFALTLSSGLTRPLACCFREDAAPVWCKAVPVIAVPTTAGSGAEVTPFATVWDATTQKKYSLEDERLRPVATLIDPALTLSLPETETLYGALDAISHAMESLWNRRRTPISEALAYQSLHLALDALPVLREDGQNPDARERMQTASLLSGMAISQTRTALAHAVSYPLTAAWGVPHGLACSFTLPWILRDNLQAIARNPMQASLLSRMLSLLESLELPARVTRLSGQPKLQVPRAQVIGSARSQNFNGILPEEVQAMLTA
jgi:phosphonate metabolism-associated iron-containing alcohol dehydrogenase